jgi:hypothetical protein
MPLRKADESLVAYCGLYCGECGKLKKEKCPGCAGNEKATWCKVRSCCIEHGYSSCADCTEFTNLEDCKKLNNFMAKTFAVIFRSDRIAGLKKIKEDGRLGFAQEMVKMGKVSYKK